MLAQVNSLPTLEPNAQLMELQCREMAEAFVESFNGRLRDECLNSLLDLGDARRKIRVWVKDDNEQRPLRSLGYLTPIEFAAAARVS